MTAQMPKMGPGPGHCDCLGCRLIRAGACFDCAEAIRAQAEQMAEPGEILFQPCSGACLEAIEQYFGGENGDSR